MAAESSRGAIVEPPLRLARTATLGLASKDSDGDDDYCYALSCVPSPDGRVVACASSSNAIHVLDRDGLALRLRLEGHTSSVTDLCFPSTASNVLFSCSMDCTLRVWDMAAGSCLHAVELGERAWGVSLGCGGTLLAVACDSSVRFLAAKDASSLGSFTACHTEEVTAVQFHPMRPTVLLSGSEDGLLCVVETRVASEDDAIRQVLNAESSVARFGLFGPSCELAFVLTHTETLSLWNVERGDRLAHFGDTRERCARALAAQRGVAEGDRRAAVDTLIDCVYCPVRQRLFLVTGTRDGSVHVFHLSPAGVEHAFSLTGGHIRTVRCVRWTADAIFTGGEDGRLCAWRHADAVPPAAGHGPGPAARHSMAKAKKARFKPY